MITGLDHATISTSKLAETRAFFCGALGLEVGYRPAFDIPGEWLYAAGRPILHLVEETGPRSPAGAIDHFSFAVDDLTSALARLDAAGVAYHHQGFPDGRGGQAFCRDPNDVLIEITCRPSRTPVG